MRTLLLCLAILMTGCENSILDPGPDTSADGTYAIESMTGQSLFTGADVSHEGGALTLRDGVYELEITWKAYPSFPANTHRSTGTFTIEENGAGRVVAFTNAGHFAVIDGPRLKHRWGQSVDIIWRRQ